MAESIRQLALARWWVNKTEKRVRVERSVGDMDIVIAVVGCRL